MVYSGILHISFAFDSALIVCNFTGLNISTWHGRNEWEWVKSYVNGGNISVATWRGQGCSKGNRTCVRDMTRVSRCKIGARDETRTLEHDKGVGVVAATREQR